MANQWLRLWHDMPNDPKWKTIARISEEPISLVLAMYLHLLVDASQQSNAALRNALRGNVTVTHEDLASALDVTEAQIAKIFSAMEGRVIENNSLSGWEKRQPKREDFSDEEGTVKGNSQRQRDYRERQKLLREQEVKIEESQQSNAASRKVTLDKDKDKDKENTKTVEEPDGFDSFWQIYPKKVAKPAALKAFKSAKINGHLPDVLQDIAQKTESESWTKNNGAFIPNPSTYLNQRRWEDLDNEPTHIGVIPGAI